jgi:hypothetical protein
MRRADLPEDVEVPPMTPLNPMTLLTVCLVASHVAWPAPQQASNPAPTAAKAPDVWQPLRHLIGRWKGTTSGQPGEGEVEREYRFVLNERFIEVRNRSTYPAQEKNPKGEVHEDIGYISYDTARRRFVFRQFHVEGYVNTYVQDGLSDAEIVFVTDSIENIPAGWRARERYRILPPNELVEIFELAEPGQDYTRYSQSRLVRAATAERRFEP